MTKLKVGDRVEVKNKTSQFYKKKGIITEIDNEYGSAVDVDDWSGSYYFGNSELKLLKKGEGKRVKRLSKRKRQLKRVWP